MAKLRATLKCYFCNSTADTSHARRHLESCAGLPLAEENVVYATMRATSSMYTKRQVVSRSSLIDFTESCRAVDPLFSAIPADTLLQFGMLLLQQHGTAVDSDDLSTSFQLPLHPSAPAPSVPARRGIKRRRSRAPRKPPTSQPQPVCSTSSALADAPVTAAPATSVSKRRSRAPRKPPTSQPQPVCSTSSALADAPVTAAPVTSVSVSKPSILPADQPESYDFDCDFFDQSMSSSPGGPPLSPSALLSPPRDMLSAVMIDAGVLPPACKRGKFDDDYYPDLFFEYASDMR